MPLLFMYSRPPKFRTMARTLPSLAWPRASIRTPSANAVSSPLTSMTLTSSLTFRTSIVTCAWGMSSPLSRYISFISSDSPRKDCSEPVSSLRFLFRAPSRHRHLARGVLFVREDTHEVREAGDLELPGPWRGSLPQLSLHVALEPAYPIAADAELGGQLAQVRGLPVDQPVPAYEYAPLPIWHRFYRLPELILLHLADHRFLRSHL